MAEAGFIVCFSFFVFCKIASDVIKEDTTDASTFSAEIKLNFEAKKVLTLVRDEYSQNIRHTTF